MTGIDRRIAEGIASSKGLSVTKLGLRFDRVVVRLLGDLRSIAESVVPEEFTVLISVTAPIRQPEKTATALRRKIEAVLAAPAPGRDRKITVRQNEVRMRLVSRSTKRAPKLIGFVHNPETNSRLLLDLAEEWLAAKV